MKKIVKLTESDLKRIVERVKSESEIDEGFIGDLVGDVGRLRFGNIRQGIKGLWKGEGYNYYRQLNILKRAVSKSRRYEMAYADVMRDLKYAQVDISESDIPDDKKNELLGHLGRAISSYDSYKSSISSLGSIVDQKFKEPEEKKRS
jgi:hypothetical protein